tara:strand:- start:1840 stop:2079 length:240 start_codon:yes stop_codon:yes gene_type:complete
MSLKEKVQEMREVTRVRSFQHQWSTQQVYATLYAYIDELEAKLEQASKPEPKKAPAKKAPAKKAPAKKAPAKRAPAKKK